MKKTVTGMMIADVTLDVGSTIRKYKQRNLAQFAVLTPDNLAVHEQYRRLPENVCRMKIG